MELLFNRLPELAEAETREMMVLEESEGLPKGKYSMLESYCNDKSCDCRRVFINVFFNDKTPIATIGYGWESLDFYERWINDRKLAIDVKGPTLEPSGYNSKYAEAMLLHFKATMLNDRTFVNRLEKHYRLFKQSLKEAESIKVTQNNQKRKIGRNELCPCGSGKKYKKCCLKS